MAKCSLVESSTYTHSILEAFVQNVEAQRVGRAENAQLPVAFIVSLPHLLEPRLSP